MSALFMIHGDFGDGFESWSAASDQIGRRYRTIVADRPGFGVLLGPDSRFSIGGEAGELLHVVVTMGLDSVHLVGHSYGGLIALEMAVRQPALVRSLHLIEPPLLALLPRHPLAQEMDRRVRAIQREHAAVGDEATTEAFFAMIGAEHVPERLRGTPEWTRLHGYAERFARNEPAADYHPSSLARLEPSIPLGLYTGGRSHSALRDVTRELARRFDRARLTDVAGAGHAVQMAGEAFVDPLLALVAEADAMWALRRSAAPDSAGEEGALG